MEPHLKAYIISRQSDLGPILFEQETVLSKLYFFQEKVLKWYKPVKAYYGDLKDFTSRERFYRDDFIWNQTMSPEIYTALHAISPTISSKRARNLAHKKNDFVIEMKRLRKIKTLSQMLIDKKTSPKIMRDSIKVLLAAGPRIQNTHGSPKIDAKLDYLTIYLELISDLQKQLYRARAHLPVSEANSAINELRFLVKNVRYFRHFPTKKLIPAVDCHTDNVVFEKGKVALIDSMFPKANWRTVDELHTVARFATNAAVLGSPALRDFVYKLYGKKVSDDHEEAALIHEIRTALMQWSRRNLLGEPELAEKFRKYAFTLMKELRIRIDVRSIARKSSGTIKHNGNAVQRPKTK
jgi:aminoglycoside phosphotransferase family enzyme